MIKRTIEISQQPAHLTVRLDQLLVQPHDMPKEFHKSIPCEDIGIILVDHQQTTYSHAALASLVEFDAALVVCGRNHLPTGILLPLSNHTEVIWRIHDQLAVSKPTQKQLWKQLVQAKIRAQLANLPSDSPERKRLLVMIGQVRSGDTSNCEAQAAKIYWNAWLPKDIAFRRDPDGCDPINAMLNYGYSVLRASVARALVGAGLLPMLGLHHRNRSNAFCLADDLVEPLRPIIDRIVRDLYVSQNRRELNQATKAGLLGVLTQSVRVEDECGPLMVALHRMVASLVRCYQGESTRLTIPVAAGESC